MTIRPMLRAVAAGSAAALLLGGGGGKVWLPDLPADSRVKPETLHQVAQAAATTAAAAPADQHPRVLWLTIPQKDGSALVACGSGTGWRAALEEARKHLPPASPEWLKLDVGSAVLPFRGQYSAGLEGLAAEYPLALLPQELTHRPPAFKRPKYRVTTQACLWRRQGCTELYRGHRLLSPTAIDSQRLLAAARAAGDFLLRQLDAKGRFHYSYDPVKDRFATSYNLLRHAGCCYALAQLFQASQDDAYLGGAQRGLNYLNRFVKADGDALCLVEDGQVKLGGNALTIIAMLEYQRVSGDHRWAHSARGLGRSLLRQQRADGSFEHRRDFASGKSLKFISEYYPGEAILALLYLHDSDPQGPWLNSAVRAARYLILVRDKNLPDQRLPHDHWLLIGLARLQQARPDPTFANHMRRVCRSIGAAQIRTSEHPDWVGGFYDPPQLTPTSTRGEGLCAALPWLPAEDAPATRQTIQQLARFLVQGQLEPENCAYFKCPRLCLGGVPRGLDSYQLRIDYAQHFISALLGARGLYLKTGT